METYYREIVRVLTAIRETQGEAMERAAARSMASPWVSRMAVSTRTISR